jgi:nucleoside-diphosphate-sugar epimerase
MKVLVTGGGGFIGSHLVQALLEDGHEVRILDNFATGRRENLLHLGSSFDLVEGDIQSYERVHNAALGCEVVLHQAAMPSVPRSIQDPLTSNASNVIGTLNVLLAARDNGVRRVIFASSSSVYGASAGLPKQKSQTPLPISPYGVAKLAGEGYCRSFHAVYGLETVALRYFNVFGPRQDPLSQYAAVIPTSSPPHCQERALRFWRRQPDSRFYLHLQGHRRQPPGDDGSRGRRGFTQCRLWRADLTQRGRRGHRRAHRPQRRPAIRGVPARRGATLDGEHRTRPRGARL